MSHENQLKREGYIAFVIFCITIPLANWMIHNVGTFCTPEGICVLPVAPGFSAPSGVLMVGFALVLRDIVQRSLGAFWSLGAIVIGTIISSVLAPPALVIASATAFFISELADFLVYTPLQKKGFVRAVVVSSFVGLVCDSAVFLYLAFGDLDFLSGQIIGKTWMVVLSIPLISWMRNRDVKVVAVETES